MARSQPMGHLALPVRMFYAAMQRQISLDAYAASLDVPGDALRALLTAQAAPLAPEIVSRLAAAHGHDPSATLAPLSEVTAAESFSDWLNRHMEGISQTSLRARTQLGAPLLRAFLSGKALPDAEQAERIARALYVDSVEMARIIVADMTWRAKHPGGAPGPRPEAAQAAEGSARAPAEPSPAPPDTPAPKQARRRRQPADSSGAPPTPAEAQAAALAPPAPALNEAAQQQAGPPPGGADIAEPRAGRRRRAPAQAPVAPPVAEPASVPIVAPAAEAAAASSQDAPPPTSVAGDVKLDMPPVRRKGRQPAATVDPPSSTPPMEAPASEAARGRAAEAPPAEQPPTVAAEVRPVETTLQLSSDELRLIRAWRRLQSQGRRATMQYIGSLLIEE